MVASALAVKFLSLKSHRTSVSHHWLKKRLGAASQQDIAWANVHPDHCRYMASVATAIVLWLSPYIIVIIKLVLPAYP